MSRRPTRKSAKHLKDRDYLVIDNFAGGGGASTGIEAGIGRPPDIAINHDVSALWMHAANHPETLHYCEDLGSLDPVAVTHGKPVRLAWFSPDCRHFSRAKGGKPVSKKIRGLAWCIPEWAEKVKPDMIFMENVREFLGWGPLTRKKVKAKVKTKSGKKITKMVWGWFPNPKKMGQTFNRWKKRLENIGYVIEYRILNAADYGAPTNRRRLFIIMRRDGQAIVWPDKTHGPGLLPYRTAAECIDWSIPCPSIFDRKIKHKEKTLDRVARGVFKYVIDNPTPFIVRLGQTGGNGDYTNDINDPLTTVVSKQEHCVVDPYVVRVDNAGSKHFRGQPTDKPLGTIVKKNGFALVTPHISTFNGTNKESNKFRGAAVDEPLRTQTASKRHAVVQTELAAAAGIIDQGYGERKGQKPRVRGVDKPVNTIVKKQKSGLVTAFLNKHYTGVIGQKLDQPAPTITAVDHSSLTAVSLMKHRGKSAGQSVKEPMPTITSGAGAKRPAGAAHALGLLAATIVKNNHGEPSSKPIDEPLPPITTQTNRNNLAAASLLRFQNHQDGQDIELPLGVTTAQANKAGLVYAFLTKHYSTGGQDQSCADSLHTISTKDRFGLVTVMVDGEPHIIVDIGLRMLQPRELATAQGFGEDYILTGTKANQVAKIGNSVPPPMVKALVKANWRKDGSRRVVRRV